MNSSEILLFLGFNIIILVLTVGLLIGFRFMNRRRENAFSPLIQSLEMLGFKKQTWQSGIPFLPFGMLDGYYHGVVAGRSYEVHFFPGGTQRYVTFPEMEIVLLGYFNARLSVSTPGWDKMHSYLAWSMPRELILPGCDDLVIRTADEDSARFLLAEPVSRDPILALSGKQKTASVLIAPKDIHFNIQLDNPESISVLTIQDWLKNLDEIAEIAAALPPLKPEAVYDFHMLARKNRPNRGRLILLMTLAVLILPLIIIALLLKR